MGEYEKFYTKSLAVPLIITWECMVHIRSSINWAILTCFTASVQLYTRQLAIIEKTHPTPQRAHMGIAMHETCQTH